MGARTGSADLPLHGGKVPRWLAADFSSLPDFDHFVETERARSHAWRGRTVSGWARPSAAPREQMALFKRR